MYRLWRKLHRLEPAIKPLIKKVTDIQIQSQQARKDLLQAQEHLNSHLFDSQAIEQVKLCNDHLIQLNQVEESILMQKAKITWLKLRDNNNSFFHALVKEMNKHKRLYTLTSLNGNVISTQKTIEEEIIEFYKLVGTTTTGLKVIDILIIRRGNSLSWDSSQKLNRPVDDKKNWNELVAIGNTKSPGIDGFNSFFFKFAWPIVKYDVQEAIMEFFQTKDMYLAVHCSRVSFNS
ncbi:unnamed protein product [Lathyrus sativus]|nr:unnamed protein product [Lathyrus sativus]